MEGIQVNLKADIIGNLWGFPITNTFATSIIGSVVLILLVIYLNRKISIIPSRFQLVVEYLTEGVRNYVDEVLEDKKVSRKVFPVILSLFIFILFLNLFKFLPGTESILYNGVQLLRPAHSDLNMTIALAIVSFIIIQVLGVTVLGFWKYSSKFINLKKPASIPFGLIELISEIAKLVSLSFRLFGNILVGGILLLLILQVSHYVIPLPVIFFEIFVAFLQATLFAVLTLFYIKMAISKPH